jgi:hypothetical protein
MISQIQDATQPKSPERIYRRSEYNRILAEHPTEFPDKVRSGAWRFLDDEAYQAEQIKTLPPGAHLQPDGSYLMID